MNKGVGFGGNVEDGFEKLMTLVEDNEVNDSVKNVVEEPQKLENTENRQHINNIENASDKKEVKDSEVKVEVIAPIENETPIISKESHRNAPKSDEDNVDWEHKFKTLQGIHQVDLGKAREKEATLLEQLEAERLERQIVEEKLAEIPINYAEIMGEEAFEDLGEDTVVGIDSLVKEQVSRQMQTKDAEIENLKEIIANLQYGFEEKVKVEEEVSKQAVLDRHDKAVLAEVPEFLSLLKDGEFIDWLKRSKDAVSGASMYDVFDEADKALNSDYVANICKLYLTKKREMESSSYNADEHISPELTSQTPESEPDNIMKWSDYNIMVSKYLNQKISDAEFVRFEQAFEQAKKAGRVQ
jgi:hypothetical protein